RSPGESRSTSSKRQPFIDLLPDSGDEPRRLPVGVPAGVKRVAPLSIRQLCEPLTDPSHILDGNVLHQLLMAPVEGEPHEAVVDAADERLPLEALDVAAARIHPPRLAERRAEILDDIPVARALARVAGDLVQLVVLVLQVGAVQDDQQDEEALVRTR